MNASSTPPAGALAGLRVLDLTQSAEQYCGRLLAQLGADVTLVEPPRGAASRHRGPYLNGTPAPDASLYFNYLNEGKRGVVVDLETPTGRQALHELAREADVLIESCLPAKARRLGIDFESLRATNPKLIVVSITPFGQDGPYADYVGDDLVAMALGGFLYLGGYADREPMGAPGDQALLAGAQFAAVAIAIAVWDAERDPAAATARHIDVSVQEAIAMGLENAAQFAELEDVVRRRQGGEQRVAGMGVFPCKDGEIYYMAGGIGGSRFWPDHTQWMIDEQVAGAQEFRDPQWTERDFLATPQAKQRFEDIFVAFTRQRTKAELYEEAQRRRLPLAPLNTAADVVSNPQLAYRGFFVDASIPGRESPYRVPGAPFLMSETPCVSGRAAPALASRTPPNEHASQQ
ncbi:CaiB/BaiF CoA transferase family protein [Bordetella genomosp. 13]|uniref:Succinyl-CoA--benzylsuccinate CoA-transferase n=1 Tax=Bordetella genomosp. 13 TaxID=463040 RepID=A0A1W6ZGK0_9BORD|nr:CoA transferase [Bordetella genomosp. 13]ARP96533.1 succinyl-CoA--benzylsuccinate CoA-transferase [Bordetella genomosp. 13]